MYKLTSLLLLALLSACQVNVTPAPSPTASVSATPSTTPSPSPSATVSPTPEPSPTAPASVGLDQTFNLQGGQSARINAEDLTIQFTRIVQDSRCPSDVQCIRAGDVTVGLTVSKGSNTQALELTSGAAETATSAKFDDYTVKLSEVRPTSKTSTQTLSLADYTISLSVSKP